jgi:hypothetical protein
MIKTISNTINQKPSQCNKNISLNLQFHDYKLSFETKYDSQHKLTKKQTQLWMCHANNYNNEYINYEFAKMYEL